MRTDTRPGFTLLEVLISCLLLTAGIGALLGTALRTTRMVHRGRQSTRALDAADSQLEALRDRAAVPPAYCGGLVDGADSSADGLVRRWRITSAGSLRQVLVEVAVPVSGGRATDTLTASLWCP
jgi:type II secretory pathway component PulJ